MEREMLLTGNLKRITGIYNILKCIRVSEPNNCVVSIKAIEIVLDSIRDIYAISHKLLNLAIDIDDYIKYVTAVISEKSDYLYKINKTHYICIKEKLYRILQELSNLGLGYEDMMHTYNAYIIIDNYIWDNGCNNDFILKFSREAISKDDILQINRLFKDIFEFTLHNAKLVNRIYSDRYIQQLLFKSRTEKTSERQMKNILFSCNRTYTRRQQDGKLIDAILKICTEIIDLTH